MDGFPHCNRSSDEEQPEVSKDSFYTVSDNSGIMFHDTEGIIATHPDRSIPIGPVRPCTNPWERDEARQPAVTQPPPAQMQAAAVQHQAVLKPPLVALRKKRVNVETKEESTQSCPQELSLDSWARTERSSKIRYCFTDPSNILVKQDPETPLTSLSVDITYDVNKDTVNTYAYVNRHNSHSSIRHSYLNKTFPRCPIQFCQIGKIRTLTDSDTVEGAIGFCELFFTTMGTSRNEVKFIEKLMVITSKPGPWLTLGQTFIRNNERLHIMSVPPVQSVQDHTSIVINTSDEDSGPNKSDTSVELKTSTSSDSDSPTSRPNQMEGGIFWGCAVQATPPKRKRSLPKLFIPEYQPNQTILCPPGSRLPAPPRPDFAAAQNTAQTIVAGVTKIAEETKAKGFSFDTVTEPLQELSKAKGFSFDPITEPRSSRCDKHKACRKLLSDDNQPLPKPIAQEPMIPKDFRPTKTSTLARNKLSLTGTKPKTKLKEKKAPKPELTEAKTSMVDILRKQRKRFEEGPHKIRYRDREEQEKPKKQQQEFEDSFHNLSLLYPPTDKEKDQGPTKTKKFPSPWNWYK